MFLNRITRWNCDVLERPRLLNTSPCHPSRLHREGPPPITFLEGAIVTPMRERPVLVIEDHSDTRHMVEEFLTFSGIPVVGAQNGQEGLTALRQHSPCLILLDLTMPVMDG